MGGHVVVVPTERMPTETGIAAVYPLLRREAKRRRMLIQINTDSNIEGDNALAQEVEAVVRNTLDRFSEHITRVEVHLSDENSANKVGTNAKRCLLEARLAGRQPVAVSHQAPTVAQAVDGAADRMKRMLVSTLGRLDDQ
jgi:ribosome-associated translation inhibitor RaiA